jgi:hypothetical protein
MKINKTITNETLTEERQLFVYGFIVLVIIGIILNNVNLSLFSIDTQEEIDKAVMFFVAAIALGKIIFIYLVFRLSRFLENPIWLTIIYCILTPFPLLYLIPFIGVLVGVRNKRKLLNEK